MSTWTDLGGSLGLQDERGQFTVQRHAGGRKYWGVTYPDGTYTHNALTQAEAKKQAEDWQPDPSLVALVERQETLPARDRDETGEPDPASTSGQDDLPSSWLDDYIADAERWSAPRGGYYSTTGEQQAEALHAVHALAQLRAEVEHRIREEVEKARIDTGSQWYPNAATWEQIGKALGVSKQSAQGRYGGSRS